VDVPHWTDTEVILVAFFVDNRLQDTSTDKTTHRLTLVAVMRARVNWILTVDFTPVS